MTTMDSLFVIEEGFWMAGKEHFLTHLDAECLLVFPQEGQMHGVFSRESIADSASMPGRWRDLAMTDRSIVQPTAEMAVISYRADVVRGDGEPYAALVGSGYVLRDKGWKLAFHQHAPV
jgi:hypothetical protein